jgi:hypothetical protein
MLWYYRYYGESGNGRMTKVCRGPNRKVSPDHRRIFMFYVDIKKRFEAQRPAISSTPYPVLARHQAMPYSHSSGMWAVASQHTLWHRQPSGQSQENHRRRYQHERCSTRSAEYAVQGGVLIADLVETFSGAIYLNYHLVVYLFCN